MTGSSSPTPTLYGVTPTFLRQPRLEPQDFRAVGIDVAVHGVPWEGSITWGPWSGCVLAPRTIREASARLSGFLPEYAIDAFDQLRLADAGEVAVDLEDRATSFASIEQRTAEIIAAGALPVALGGDHSIALPLFRGVLRGHGGSVGLIVFDSHLDNHDEFQGDRYARNTPFRRIPELPEMDPTKMVYIAIRGARNDKALWMYAQEIGATVMTIADVRRGGIEACIERAIAIASSGADCVYATVCSDVLEAAFNPGGPPDPSGLTPYELFRAAHLVGRMPKLAGFDFCEVLPPDDPTGLASHTAAWTILHLLTGVAARRAEAARGSQTPQTQV